MDLIPFNLSVVGHTDLLQGVLAVTRTTTEVAHHFDYFCEPPHLGRTIYHIIQQPMLRRTTPMPTGVCVKTKTDTPLSVLNTQTGVIILKPSN